MVPDPQFLLYHPARDSATQVPLFLISVETCHHYLTPECGLICRQVPGTPSIRIRLKHLLLGAPSLLLAQHVKGGLAGCIILLEPSEAPPYIPLPLALFLHV